MIVLFKLWMIDPSEFVDHVVIDLCAKSFLLVGSKEEENLIECDTTDEFMRARWSDEGPEAGRERLEGVLQDRGEDRIVVPREGSMVLVPFDELEWIEAADQYVRLHLLDGREELMRASMGHLEKRLGGGTFMRVHRSAIVRVDRVVELSSATSGTGRIRLRGGAEVPVSRTRLALVRRALR